MTKVYASFVVLFFAALLSSFQTHAETLSERVQQTFRYRQSVRVSELLRVSPYDESQYEVHSLTVSALSYTGGRMEILIDGRSTIQPKQLGRVPSQIRLTPPAGMTLRSLEILSSSGEIFIESVSAEVTRRYSQPYPQPGPGRPVPGPGRPVPGPGYPAPGPGYPMPGPGYPGPSYPEQSPYQRVYVGQELSQRYPLELSRLLPYESREVRSISIEGRIRDFQVVVFVYNYRRELVGSAVVNQYNPRPVIQLFRSVPLRDLRLESNAGIQIDSLELEFERYPRY